jgi:hypothetical protein
LNSSTSKALKLILPLILGVALVWYSLTKISIPELLKYFKNANYWWVGLGLFCGFLSHLSRAYRWKYLLEPLGYTLRFPNSVMAVFATYLVNYTIPRAGEVTRATIIANYEGVPFEKGFGTIVSERVADMIVLLGIIAVTLYLEFDFIYDFLFRNINPFKIVIGLIGLLAIGLIVYTYFKRSKSNFVLKIKNFLKGLMEGALSIFKMKHKWAFIAHTLFIWAMYVLMFYVTSFAVEELQPIPMSAILIGFVAGSFSIAATNGGIGSFPEAIVLAFLVFSIPEDPSRAFGWIMWSSQTLMIIIFGSLSFLLLPIYNRIK